MRNTAATWLIIGGLLCVLTAPIAQAQRPPNPLRPRGLQNRSTVSPYLNLGVSSNGISNYGSLVRPLLNEREAQAQQAMNDARRRAGIGPRQQANRTSSFAPPSESPAMGQSRFMNLSHYYGGGH